MDFKVQEKTSLGDAEMGRSAQSGETMHEALGQGRPMTIEEQLNAMLLNAMFGRHCLSNDQEMRSNLVRLAARALGQVILQAVPQCTDRTAALRHVRDALMTANSAISHQGVI